MKSIYGCVFDGWRFKSLCPPLRAQEGGGDDTEVFLNSFSFNFAKIGIYFNFVVIIGQFHLHRPFILLKSVICTPISTARRAF
ncbi:MAG: hypothetical protein K2O78_09820 [Muribaculaceae bacterium]|nr:hypothetical protein [Muribaculaceae bacterium]MDE7081935.1 hypothetical protein [Muribaculaceae bacterium]